ncbi:MAG TPA: hypothetical protein VF487_07870 [Chitinophagaceae bacterium]
MKLIVIMVGSLLILVTAFHFWFVHHAEQIIQDLVSSKSNGKIKLEIRNFKFNWFSKKMELEDAVFYSTDSINAGVSYRFGVKEIKLKVKAVLPMVFEKKVFINTLSLQQPDIVVTRLRSSTKDSTRNKEDVSLPHEMGKIYNSIQDALQVLEVKKFEIENAKFTLINRMRPDDIPIKITHIDFHIDNLSVDTTELTGKEKIFFSDNVVLKSRDQDILFPDGRHRLSYRKFRINIEKKIVEFDSCTIAALKTDSTSAGFSIYFDALQLTNIDFDTLYRTEVIKADSVYCVNPQFKLNVDLDKRTGAKKKRPKLDQVIRQLTGNLMLNFVVVNNASFDINTMRNGKPSSFTSNGNNFEMQGLRIDNDAKHPLKVEKLAMAIRNYENFLKDSLYALQFDSILVNNDKIYLNDFSFQQLRNGRVINRFKVPRFQLTGLSWEDLLFEKRLVAQQAVLFYPTIDFTEAQKNSTDRKGTKDLFTALANVNEIIMLEDLNIVKGNIDLHLNGNIDLQLKDATLSIESRALLGSEKLSGIRRSVNHLDFSKGFFRVNDLTVNLNNIKYTGADSRLNAGSVSVTNDSKTLYALAKKVMMNEIFINENTGDVSIAGVKWDEAEVNLTDLKAGRNKSNRSFISLTDIDGNNTRVRSSFGNKKMSAFVNHLGAVAFLLKPGEKPLVADLALSGKDFILEDPQTNFGIAAFTIEDLKKASFENIGYVKKGIADTIRINVPQLSFVPHIQAAISNEIRADDMTIIKPFISVYNNHSGISDSTKGLNFPMGNINKLVIEQPEIHISRQKEKGISTLDWNGNNAKNNSIVLLDVKTGKTSVDAKQLYLSLNNFVFEDTRGKSFNAGNGEVAALLNDIHFEKQDNAEVEWNAALATLEGKNFVLDSLGKKAGKLDIATVQLKDLALSSSSLASIRKVVEGNKKFRIGQITGSYINTENVFKWYNAGYDKSNNFFSADSFYYSPSAEKETFIKNHPYQADYIQINTGAIHLGPFDIDKYLRDSIVRIGLMKIDSLRFNDFRDNRPPFHAGIFKPLMTERIKTLPFKISVDTILMNNTRVLYAEVNPKTNQTAIVPVTRMTLRAFPVRNFDLKEEDSLRIQANGYLMDSIWVRIRLRESYIDSLEGFLLTVRMKGADMKVLNSVLIPLASAKLRSGILDTMSMRVAGNDFLSYGEMEMLYHDLKIQIVNAEKKKFFTGVLNFLANTFVVRNKNTKQVHKVFFIRKRDRSSINYLVKMVMSGVTSSVGVKSNHKIIRQYKKELKQRNLPPLDYD